MQRAKRISSTHDVRYKRLIQALVKRREESGISQAQMSAALGLSQPDISKIERFERRLDLLEAIDWFRAIGADNARTLTALWNEAQLFSQK